MKKWWGVLLAMALTLCPATAWAAVPSKTTTDISRVVSVETVSGMDVDENFVVEIVPDLDTVALEIQKLYAFVNAPGQVVAPILYFPEEVEEQVRLRLPEEFDLNTLELNEIISIYESGYEERYGDIKVTFAFTTQYQPGQKLVALAGYYSGAMDEAMNYLVLWRPLEAEVLEDGTVTVLFSVEDMVLLGESHSTALAILSEPMPPEPAV